MDLQPDEVGRLQQALDTFGIAVDLKSAIEREQYHRRLGKEWHAIQDLIGDKTSILTDAFVRDPMRTSFVDAIGQVRTAGRDDVEDWMERNTQDETGVSVVRTIVDHIGMKIEPAVRSQPSPSAAVP